ncbi:MAG: hypothetical protein NWQ54_19985 [Paraglaciecola sp.]|nr:hypothetical protein [Paraglaciecola sp.]
MTLTFIELKTIDGIHKAVQTLLAETADMIYASAPGDYSNIALETLLQIHPIHLLKDEGKFFVIAGFRGFEMAKLCFEPDTELRCLVHIELDTDTIQELALIDIVGSPLLHSLGSKHLQQILALVKPFGAKATAYFPKTSSIRRIRGNRKPSN